MGQVLGRALFQEGALPFVNLQRNAVYDLWESFNDVAEGFGINMEEFKEISLDSNKRQDRDVFQP